MSLLAGAGKPAAASAAVSPGLRMGRARVVGVVALFAWAYFLSALVRAVTATLAPTLTQEFALTPADLGLLAGAYFLGFAAPQLALGHGLDTLGPRRVLAGFLSIAVLGCVAFALAEGRPGLVIARVAIGVGVCACLMAPLTAFRHWFSAAWQMRLNSWMLMTGATGMLASTLPVQWLLPAIGWRGLFWGLALLFGLALVAILMAVPRDAAQPAGPARQGAAAPADRTGYRDVWRHPAMIALAPMAFLLYGGLIALQTLWAGPWITQVQGRSPAAAAEGLFLINLAMLFTFAAWGWVMPALTRRGFDAPRLMRGGIPLALLVVLACAWSGAAAGAPAWAAFFVICSVISLSQPFVGQAVDVRLAGRALSAFNLLIFSGVFAVQWSIGLSITALQSRFGTVDAFRLTMALWVAACICSYAWFVWRWYASGRRLRAEEPGGHDGLQGTRAQPEP